MRACLLTDSHRRCLLFAALAVALLLPGCGNKRKTTFPVKGQILVDGKPAPDAFVTFHPVDESDPKLVRPFGRADEQGNFQISTYDSNDGAPAGEYILTIEWRERSGLLKDQLAGPDRLKGRYADRKKSKFKVQINEAPTELKPFELTTQ